MPKRLFIKDGGLSASIPTPTGFTVIGSDNGTPKKQIQSTISDIGLPYKIYSALLTQTGTASPVATVLENTLGGEVVWTYSNVGRYRGELVGAFTENKTTTSTTSADDCISIFIWNDVDSVDVKIYDINANLANGYLNKQFFEIRVYN